MNIIFDNTAPFTDVENIATELLYKTAEGLSENHVVHVITPHLEFMEHRKPQLFLWPPMGHPDKADVVVMMHSMDNIAPYSANVLVFAGYELGVQLGKDDNYTSGIDRYSFLTQYHVEAFLKQHRLVRREKCHVTGIGTHVDSEDYNLTYLERPKDTQRVPGRFFWSNSPERGLLEALEIFRLVHADFPETSFRLASTWRTYFEQHKFGSSALAEYLWKCYEAVKTIPGVQEVEITSTEDERQERDACSISLYPSSSPNISNQLHDLLQLKYAVSGCAIITSAEEALPEVLAEGAEFLPLPGQVSPEGRWKISDWADAVKEVLQESSSRKKLSDLARMTASRYTYGKVVTAWETMLGGDVLAST